MLIEREMGRERGNEKLRPAAFGGAGFKACVATSEALWVVASATTHSQQYQDGFSR